MWPLPTMEADCIDRSICMRLATLHLVALLLALGGRANAQATDSAATDPGQLVSRWQAANTTCRSPAATAMSAVGACEQRDTLSKLLAQMNYCYGVATWAACSGAKASQEQARTTAEFHRMGGVFVLPAVINGGTKSYFIVDSGAANVQIPEEVADEMRRAGTLADLRGRASLADAGQWAAAAGVPPEEPADRRPDDGERPGRRRRTEEPGVAGPKLPASTELVEDRQCEERDGVRTYRVILEAPPAPSGVARQNRDRDARPRAALPPSS